MKIAHIIIVFLLIAFIAAGLFWFFVWGNNKAEDFSRGDPYHHVSLPEKELSFCSFAGA